METSLQRLPAQLMNQPYTHPRDTSKLVREAFDGLPREVKFAVRGVRLRDDPAA